jgi:hypothetical protein
MANKQEQIRDELRRLVADGQRIFMVERIRAFPQVRTKFEEAAKKKTGPKASKDIAKEHLNEAKDPDRFRGDYQRWYSTALPVIKSLLPDRYSEFRELYRLEHRKEIDVTTYTVSDFARGIVMMRGGNPDDPVFDHQSVGLTRFKEQIEILESAEARLDSSLADISGVIEADLIDDELEAARELLTARHLRSAGVVAGVVLERHLKRVASNHEIALRKKPVLSNLNEALKTAKVYDLPQWRQVQRLTDLRNLCGHDGERAPSKDEIHELIEGVDKVVTTVF